MPRRPSRKKHHLRFSSFLLLALIPVLVLVVFFYASDEFYIYAQLLLLDKYDEANSYSGMSDEEEREWFSSTGGTTGGSASSGGLPQDYGQVGAQMILTNKMGAGYLKDWLTIAQSHVDWSNMQIEASQRNGVGYHPNILLIIGSTLAETGWPSDFLPETILDLDYYNTEIDGQLVNLYNVDSTLIGKHPEIVAEPYNNGTLKSGGFHTQFQFQYHFFGKYPDGSSGGNTGYYPSKMNSPTMGNDLRGPADNDAGFFPDQVSTLVQSAWGRAQAAVQTENISHEMMNHLSYSVHNAGNGIFWSCWSLQGRPGTDYSWNTVNPQWGVDLGAPYSLHQKNQDAGLSHKYIGTEAVNTVVPLIEKARKYLYGECTSVEKANSMRNDTFHFLNHGDYEALFTVQLLLNGGFIASDKVMSNLKFHMNNDGWMRGALLGYKLETGKWDATQKDVTDYLNSLTVQTIDEGFYGPTFSGKPEKYHEIVVHMYCDSINVYNKDGAGPKPALHAFTSEPGRGAYMSAIGSPYIYWRMLLTAGVECTLQEAYEDATGLGRALPSNSQPTLSDTPSGSQGQLITQITQTVPALEGSYYSDFNLGYFTDDTNSAYFKSNSPIYYRDPAGGGSPGIHGGEDYPLPKGTKLIAIGNGTVRHAGYMSGYGYAVIIDLDTVEGERALAVLYGHMNSVAVSVGDRVVKGQYIGDSGKSGTRDGKLDLNRYGAHLHIELRIAQKGTELRAAYGASVIEKAYTVANAPRIWYTAKKDPGHIYDDADNLLYTSHPSRYSGTTDNAEISWAGRPSSYGSSGYEYMDFGLQYWNDCVKQG